MSVEIFNSERIKAEQAARTQQTEELRKAFDEVTLLVINTGAHAKATVTRQMAATFIDSSFTHDDTKILLLPSKKTEPMSPSSSQVAKFKAEVARLEFLENKFGLELPFLLQQLNISLQQGLDDAVIKKLLAGIAFVGADTNSFRNGRQNHKLSRRFGSSLPDEEFDRLRKKLYETYVTPPTGKSRDIWDVSKVLINGRKRVFNYQIEVIAGPLDSELLEIYLAKAIADGKILSSNTNLALIEMLEESGAIISTSKLPDSLRKKGHTLKEFRQSPKPEELQAIKTSIITGAPVYVA